MCYLEPVSVEISQHGVEKIPHFLYIPFFLCVESDNDVDEVHHKLFLYCRCKCSKRKRINKISSEKSISTYFKTTGDEIYTSSHCLFAESRPIVSQTAAFIE